MILDNQCMATNYFLNNLLKKNLNNINILTFCQLIAIGSTKQLKTQVYYKFIKTYPKFIISLRHLTTNNCMIHLNFFYFNIFSKV
jgi:hypothetical protein